MDDEDFRDIFVGHYFSIATVTHLFYSNHISIFYMLSPCFNPNGGKSLRAHYSDIFRALATKERVGILGLLYRHNGLTPTQIAKCFYLEQPTISHHLHHMQRVGLVTPQSADKDARQTYYMLNIGYLEQTFDSFIQFITSNPSESYAQTHYVVSR